MEVALRSYRLYTGIYYMPVRDGFTQHSRCCAGLSHVELGAQFCLLILGDELTIMDVEVHAILN